jgi:FMN-dependent NADH-azoreductase
MSKKKTTYYPFTHQEIERYQQETSSDHMRHEELTNKALIALRRTFLNEMQNNTKLKSTVNHFSKVTKSKSVEELAKLIRILLAKS